MIVLWDATSLKTVIILVLPQGGGVYRQPCVKTLPAWHLAQTDGWLVMLLWNCEKMALWNTIVLLNA